MAGQGGERHTLTVTGCWRGATHCPLAPPPRTLTGWPPAREAASHAHVAWRTQKHASRGGSEDETQTTKKRGFTSGERFFSPFVKMGSPPPKRPRVADDAAPDITSALDRLAAKLPTRAARATPLLTKLLSDACLPWSPSLTPSVAGCLFALAGGGGAGGTPHADVAKAAARAFSAAAALAPTLWPSSSDADDAPARRTRAALERWARLRLSGGD